MGKILRIKLQTLFSIFLFLAGIVLVGSDISLGILPLYTGFIWIIGIIIFSVISVIERIFFKRVQKSNEVRIVKPSKEIEGENQAICPYCKEKLKTRPKRKKKCPHCSNYIYVNTHPVSKKKVLLTEKEKSEVDTLRKKMQFRKMWMKKIRQYGVTDSNYEKEAKKLKKKFGKEPDTQDVIWSLYHMLLKKNNDLHTLKTIYYQMALFYSDLDKDPFPLLQESAKLELMDIMKQGITNKVRILTPKNGCEICQNHNGVVLTIKEALETMPIPCRECTTQVYSEKYGFCRCSYLSEIKMPKF